MRKCHINILKALVYSNIRGNRNETDSNRIKKHEDKIKNLMKSGKCWMNVFLEEWI